MKKSVLVVICGALALMAAGCGQGKESAGSGEAPASTFGQAVSGPRADFRMSSYAGGAPAEIDFANRSANAERFLWDFGDGTTSREAAPTHIFDRAGIYPVELTAFAGSDDDDAFDTRVHVVILYQPELTDLKLEPAVVVTRPDETARLTARAFDQFGREIEGIELHWSSAEAARVDSTGVLRAGTRAGSFPQLVKVEASLGEVAMRVTADVEIVPGPLHVVELSPAVTELSIGDSVDIDAVGLDEFGNEVEFSGVEWTAVGRLGEIDSDGVLTTATTAGTFAVIARASTSQASTSASATVVVRADAFDGVVLTPSAATLQVADKLLFSAMAVDRHGNAIGDAVVTWIAEPASGRVGGGGEFTADTKPGHYPNAVTAQARQGGIVRRASASVTLEPAELAEVLVEPPVLDVAVGEAARLKVRPVDRYGNEISGLQASYTWLAAAGNGEVDPSGNLRVGHVPGAYAVEVAVRQGSIEKRARVHVTATPGPVATVLVEPASAALDVGSVQKFTVRALDIYGNEIDDLDVYWSADPAAGRISSAGVFTANEETGTYATGVRVSVYRDGVAGQGSALVRLTAPEGQASDTVARLSKGD